MFNRVCKVETIAEGGMRIVIADAHVIVLAWPENGAIKAFQGVCPHSICRWPRPNSTAGC